MGENESFDTKAKRRRNEKSGGKEIVGGVEHECSTRVIKN